MKKKKQGILDSTLALLPGLESQKSDQEAELNVYKNENAKLKKMLKEIKQEVDVYIANFLRQEVVEKEKKDQLEAQMKVIKSRCRSSSGMPRSSAKNKTIQILSAQREIKAREASKAQNLEKETKEELKIKELIIVDLSKNFSETNNRLKEFSALYDVVKNEKQVCEPDSGNLASSGGNEGENQNSAERGRDLAQRIAREGPCAAKGAPRSPNCPACEGSAEAGHKQKSHRIQEEAGACRAADCRD